MGAARAQSDSCSASPQHLLLLSCSHLVVHESVLLDDTIDVTSSHTVADLQTPQAAILAATCGNNVHCRPTASAYGNHVQYCMHPAVLPQSLMRCCVCSSGSSWERCWATQACERSTSCYLLHQLLVYLEGGGCKLPAGRLVQGRHSHTTWNEHVPAALCDGLEGPLNAIKDIAQKSRAQLH